MPSFAKLFIVSEHWGQNPILDLGFESLEHGDAKISSQTAVNISKKSDKKRLDRLDNIKNVTSYYFDGKKGPAAEHHRKTSNIEVITMISEPNSRYLGTFIKDGQAFHSQGTLGAKQHLCSNISTKII